LVRQRQIYRLSFPSDGATEFLVASERLAEKARSANLSGYFTNMFTAMEQIMARRFAMGFVPKARPWANVYDESLGRMVAIGTRPYVRTGLLVGSLAGKNEYSIRSIEGNVGRFGTSRTGRSPSGSIDLLDILSRGSSGGSPRIRTALPYLSWEVSPGFRVGVKSPGFTMDMGAIIPPRRVSLKSKPMNQQEEDMLNTMARKFWVDFFGAGV